MFFLFFFPFILPVTETFLFFFNIFNKDIQALLEKHFQERSEDKLSFQRKIASKGPDQQQVFFLDYLNIDGESLDCYVLFFIQN